MTSKIMAEAGNECEVDVNTLHEILLQLPAEKYLDLHKKIYEKIYGYSPFAGWNGCGGGCDALENVNE